MGRHNENLLKDPAIEEWIWMRQNTHRYFKINRRTAPALLCMGLAIPAATFYFSYYTQDKYNIAIAPKKTAWAEAYNKK